MLTTYRRIIILSDGPPESGFLSSRPGFCGPPLTSGKAVCESAGACDPKAIESFRFGQKRSRNLPGLEIRLAA
jgi:hypothetical protein